MLHKKLISILGCVFLVMICGCADNRAESDSQVIEPEAYEDVKILDDNLYAVKDSSGQYGFVDGQGSPVGEGRFFYVMDAGEQMVRVLDFEHKVLFVDYEGNPIGKETFEAAYAFQEGLAAVKKENQWGFINKDGELVIDYQFEEVDQGFQEGVAAVKQNGAWYFIDRNGDPASDAIQMDDQEDFRISSEVVEVNGGLTKKIQSPIPEDAKENLEYLFNNLYADRPDMVGVGLYKLEDRLYYKWKCVNEAGELSDYKVLAYMMVSEDGERYAYTAYSQKPSTEDDEAGEYVPCYSGYWEVDRNTKEIVPVAKVLLQYLFNYLYPDQSDMVDLKLYETDDGLYYKWKFRLDNGETGDPVILQYKFSTSDGLYFQYGIYQEVWGTYYNHAGMKCRKHIRDCEVDQILVNKQNYDVTRHWIRNEDKEAEFYYVELYYPELYNMENEAYVKIMDLY